MNKQPLLILALCFILGIFFQDYFLMDFQKLAIIFTVILMISSVIFLLQKFTFQRLRPVLLGILFFFSGVFLHFLNSDHSKSAFENSSEKIIFKITKKLNSTEKNKKYEAEIILKGNSENAVIFIPKSHAELDFKHIYRAVAYISSPKKPQYTFQFDYAKYLKRKNIDYQVYINENISSAAKTGVSFSEKIKQKRLEVLQKINRTPLSDRSREFLKGIILADRTEMDAETVKDFNRSGLVHFLAISGTHVVIIFGLFYYLMTKVLPIKLRKYAVISSLVFIWVFTVFIGFGSSVVRSSIMLTVYFVYVMLQRKPDLLHALSLSALIILFQDTQQIFDVGFQLSFLAVLGIFWLNQPILRLFPIPNTFAKKIVFNTVSISISAQLATLPLVLFYFHQFSVVSVPANFFIVPFSEIIIVFSLLMTVFIAAGIDFGFLYILYDSVIKFLLKIIHWFADFERLYFENIALNLVEAAALFFLVYTLRFLIMKRNLKNVAQVSSAILIFLILNLSFTIFENSRDEVLVHEYRKSRIFSVKDGGSVCFWVSDQQEIQKISQYIINPYLSSRRVKKAEIRILPANANALVFHGKTYSID